MDKFDSIYEELALDVDADCDMSRIDEGLLDDLVRRIKDFYTRKFTDAADETEREKIKQEYLARMKKIKDETPASPQWSKNDWEQLAAYP